MKRWTKEEEELALELREHGLTGSQISRRLPGRSRCAVIRKLNVLCMEDDKREVYDEDECRRHYIRRIVRLIERETDIRKLEFVRQTLKTRGDNNVRPFRAD